MPNASETRLLACRVDALSVAFRLDRNRLARVLPDRLELAERGGVELAIGRFRCELRARPQSSRTWFENADLRGTFDLKAQGGWHLEIVLRAAFLATHPIEEALRLVVEVAGAFGHVLEGPRLRRVDLAGDFLGFPLSEHDASRFATMRAGLSEFRAEAKDIDELPLVLDGPKLQVHRNRASSVTGFSVSAGNPLSARIYDKTTELNVPGRDDKRAIEHALWEHAGWTGRGKVTRVEFQLRGNALDDFDARAALDLVPKLDSLWQYATGKWLRMIVPDSATRRYRCLLDPRWITVQAVTFVHQASPAARVRCRGGARPEHVLGASFSMLASQRKLKHIEPGWDGDGVVLDERGFLSGFNDAEARTWASELASDLCGKAGRAAIEDIARVRGWRNAALFLLTRNNAAVARFSSIDDLNESSAR